MTIHRSTRTSLSTSLWVLFSIGACNVFDPPPLEENNPNLHGAGGKQAGGTSGTSNSDSGGSDESGGRDAGSAGQISAGGTTNGGAGTTGGKGGNAGSGAAGAAGAAGKGNGGSSGPTDEWWSHDTVVDAKSGATCETVGVPKDEDRPKTADPGANLAPIYFAVNRFRIGAVDEKPDPTNPNLTILPPNPNAWRDIGFDLDGSCTRSATCQFNEELVDQRACTNAETVPFDGNRCIDNSIGNLFNIAAQSPSIGDWFGLRENDWNCELWRGGFSNIYKVSDYNGQPNDDNVKVDLYTSTGLQTLPQWQCRTKIDQPLDAKWNEHALWPTKAHWIISEDSISDSADQIGTEVKDSKWQDATAYVRGGWLVAHFPDGSWIWLNGERTVVPGFREIMHRSVMGVKLVKDRQTGLWSMDSGTLSFVALPGEMLQGFGQLGFCDNMCGTFKTVKDYLNTYQDAFSTDSNAPPTASCNALSYGHVFKAAQITADMNDVKPTKPFTLCPQPTHPAAPRQGCVCSADGSKCTVDGGT